uniref:F5/8 type C domain-containing protein n=1 Tax=Angiostrongylus cantonensis TaxID=6313 RepID=A0A0K0D7J9_ANGCA
LLKGLELMEIEFDQQQVGILPQVTVSLKKTRELLTFDLQLMTANHETTTAVRRVLVPPIVASRIRIVPHSKQMRTICLRMELYGCLHRNGLLFYSTLPAGSRVGGVDFRDKTFENSDLYTETGIKRGLGLLSDGYISEYSPFDGNNPNGSWIGWSKHHTDGIVTLLFEFDQLRIFSGVLLAAYGRINSIDVIFRYNACFSVVYYFTFYFILFDPSSQPLCGSQHFSHPIRFLACIVREDFSFILCVVECWSSNSPCILEMLERLQLDLRK